MTFNENEFFNTASTQVRNSGGFNESEFLKDNSATVSGGFDESSFFSDDAQKPAVQTSSEAALTFGPRMSGFNGFGGEPRSDDFWDNLGADAGEFVDAYKTLGGMIAEDWDSGNYTKTLGMLATNFFPAIIQSYTRWYDAYDEGGMDGLLEKMHQYPLQFAQDVSLPVTMLLGGAGGVAKGIDATSKTARILGAASKLANAAEFAIDPVGGTLGFAAQKVAGKAYRTVTGKTPKTTIDVDTNVEQSVLRDVLEEKGYTNAEKLAGDILDDPSITKTDDAMGAALDEATRIIKGLTPLDAKQIAKGIFETTFEDAPPSEKFVRNLNLNRVTNVNELKQVSKYIADSIDEVPELKAKTLTWKANEEKALALGMSLEDLLKIERGTALNSVEMEAARTVYEASIINMNALKATARKTKSEVDLAQFMKAAEINVAAFDVLEGVKSEAGRALGILRKVSSKDQFATKAVREVLLQGGGRKKAQDMIKILDKAEPDQIAKGVREMMTPTLWEKFREVRLGLGLLSGPITQIKNFASNTVTGLYDRLLEAPLTSVVSSALNPIRRKIGAKTSPITMMENVGRIKGTYRGFGAAARAFADDVLKGEAFGPSKPFEYKIGAIGGPAGKVVRASLRGLSAFDSLFKAFHYTGEVDALAWRKAINEAKDGIITRKEIPGRIADLIAEEADDLKIPAMKKSENLTFTDPLGGDIITDTAKWVQEGKQLPGLGKVLDMVVPFIKTPANIAKFGLERTPFGLLFKDSRDALLGKLGAQAQDEAIARIGLGTAIGAVVVAKANDGMITGSFSSDRNKKQVERLSGYQDNSIVVGDKFYSFANIEPIGSMFGIAADFARVVHLMNTQETAANKKDLEKIPALIASSIGKNITSKTYMKGLSEAIQAFSDSDRYMERFLNNMATSVMPNLLAQTARAEDPYLREARSLTESIISKLPKARRALTERVNMWGQPIKREQPYQREYPGVSKLIGSINPIYISTDRKDKVAKEMLRLGVFPGMPSRNMTINGIPIKLTSREYKTFVEQAGIPAKEMLDSYVSDPSWDEQSDIDKANILGSVITRFRENARRNLTRFEPQIMDRVNEALSKQQRRQ